MKSPIRSGQLPCEAVQNRPIGVFDSGFGGLTVARALIDLLPRENLVYVGDTARYPYGPRDLNDVRDFSLEIAEWLVTNHNIKALVVACNTASAAALDDLRSNLDIPVIGVIEPGVIAVAEASERGRVGVIGTVGTVSSGAYQHAFAAHAPEIDLTIAACPGFVEFVERGETDSDQVRVLAERLLAPVKEAKVDSLLLGCTHYPFLARPIADAMGREVVLVSSADETAFAVWRQLNEIGVTRSDLGGPAPERRWVSSGDVAWFATMGRRLLGPELDDAESIVWPSHTTGEAGNLNGGTT